MKTLKKLLIGFFIFAFLIGILRACFPKDENKVPEKVEKLKPFDSLSVEEKDKAVTDFIFSHDYQEIRFRISELIKTSLSQSVKFPETLEYLYNNEWVNGKETYVFNSDNMTVDPKIVNRITIIVDFRSENSFSQKVRNKFKITFDFKGNEPYQLVEAKIL